VSEVNSELREYLRSWRRETAKEQGIPAFTVMHDTSLDDLCRVMPESMAALRGVYGFGERKTETYGPEILQAISRFRKSVQSAGVNTQKLPPREETLKLVGEGKSLEEIARIRECKVASVVDLVASMVEGGAMVFRAGWVDAEKGTQIERACAQHGLERLKPIKDALPAEITFDEIRLVVARLRHEQSKQRSAAVP
jgi:ATP-dependent DNA helicase RecQ